MQKLNAIKHDSTAAGILLIAGLKLVFGLENVMDISLYDESTYLYRGVKLLDNGLPNAEGAPLYAMWYYLLSLLQPNRVKLYYLNCKILTIVLPILICVLLRRYKLSALAALIISDYFLISYTNLPVWPKPAHLSTSIALIFFFFATYIQSFTSATLFVSIGALLSSFIRPEFFLAYLLLLFLYIIVVIVKFKQLQFSREILTFFAFAAISFLLLAILGQPAFSEKESRSFVAFGQHFSVNWVRWANSDINPWTSWTEIVAENFGDARSVFEALMNNPPLFLKHVIYNALGVIKVLAMLLFIHYNIILPVNTKILWVVEGCLLLFGILGTCVFYLKSRWLSELRDHFQSHKRLLIHSALYSIPGLISSVVIFPRSHYLLLQGVLVTTMIAIFVVKGTIKNDDRKENIEYKRFLLTGLLLISLTPCISDYDRAIGMSGKGQLQNVETIEFIKSLGIKEEVNLLEAEGGFHIYVGDNFHRVAEYEKDTNFNKFLNNRKINMIIFSNALKSDARFIHDEEGLLFLNNYSAFGYEKMSIPKTNRELFVKKDLLTD